MDILTPPKVSIGLPVYNGEQFVEAAIKSLLAQTFADFELIISDNASCDGTEQICRSFADIDKRVRYFRNNENIGVFRNFNRVITLSSAEYFKLASCDDLCHPTFLEKCIEALDQDPSLVVAYTRAITIDANGQCMNDQRVRPELSSFKPHERFRRAISPDETIPLFGVVRTDVLKKTALYGIYPESDVILLAELSLYGAFHEVSDKLFLLREHPNRSVRAQDWWNPHVNLNFWKPPETKSCVFPEWVLNRGLLLAIYRSPVGWGERLLCLREAFCWMNSRKDRLLRDVIMAATHIAGLGPSVRRLYRTYVDAIWRRRLRQLVRDLNSSIPSQSTFILVDDARLDPSVFGGRKLIPFLERDGKYWGTPPDDDTAIRELERLRQSHVTFIVFGWPAFWWFDSYSEFHRYLRAEFRCVRENKNLVIFDMR